MTNTAKPSELLPCQECGMAVAIAEYHPYAACLMFKACHDGGVVRANFPAIRPPSSEQAGDGDGYGVLTDAELDAIEDAEDDRVIFGESSAPAKPCDAEVETLVDQYRSGDRVEFTVDQFRHFLRGRLAQPQRQGLMSGALTEEVVRFITDTPEDVTHKALLAEGWTPPTEQPASAAVGDDSTLLPGWAASILQPGNWRDVHPGYPAKKLAVTYAKGDWDLMMAQLGAARGVAK